MKRSNSTLGGFTRKNFPKEISGGFTLIETIVYIALLSILLLSVVTSILAMGTAMASIKSSRGITINAVSAFERMTRNIRDAGEIDDTSTFDISPGRLVLNSTDPTTSATSSVTFSVSNNRLYAQTSGSAAQALTGSDVIVSALTFRKITATSSVAVKIEMTLRSSSNRNIHSRNYYDTIVLRDSYQ